MNQINNLKQHPPGTGTPPTLDELKQRATSGRAADVDFLMENLVLSRSFSRCKVIDFALNLVSSAEGQARIGHFLFNGSQIQRNYAALYFKRQGNAQLIDEAVRRGCIDEVQAYSI
jgi:hypothetical protein